MDDLTIVPLTSERFLDLAALFEQGGDPKWCWCVYWRHRSSVNATLTTPERRSELEALAAGEPPPGVIALEDGHVIGWCSVGPRTDFELLQRSRTIKPVDDRPVWSIVCFVVGKASRGRGVARQLLDGAVALAAAHGAPAVEAYPTDPGEARMLARYAYSGTLPIFLAAGFEVVAPTSSSAGGRPRVIVRKELG